ncbi:MULTISPECIES: adenylyltransferase/cytidyltransferase family protein [unclassified Vibrio]|uniref:adenylyltransferase/cytidyltransferase family protein n=1 Tax=unclassified Vibrio TaxID=2614977 RepID=UPI00354F425E
MIENGNKKRRIITFGTFDVFHIGHVNILERCASLGDTLIVGISSDTLNFEKKGRTPIYCESDRLKIVNSVKFVDEVFIEHSLELKREYINYYKADILAMGDDWEGKFDGLNDICDVIYFPRTPSVSTTEIIEIAKTF